MNKIHVVKGDLIDLAKQGKFDAIGHGVNCFCRQKSGLAKQMVENFQNEYQKTLNKVGFKKEEFELENPYSAGDINKLGQIEFEYRNIPNSKSIHVINCYTQYNYGYDKNTVYADYEAIALCFKKINHIFKGKDVGLPWIGCGLANGNKELISHLMITYLKDVNLIIVEYEDEK